MLLIKSLWMITKPMLMMLKMMAIFDNEDDEDAMLEDKGQEGTLISERSQSRPHGQRADQEAALPSI